MRNLRLNAVAAATLVAAGLFAVSPASGRVSQPQETASGADAPMDGRIVFRDGISGQVYTVNPDGSALQQVTHLGKNAFAGDPQWSPDGSHLAAWIFRNGGAFIYEMKADGTDAHPVYKDDPGWFDTTPGYTPDGSTIVFSRCQEFCAIYSVHTDGSGLTQLTKYRRGIHAGDDFHPQVSPDSKRILFVRQRSNGILSQLWLMNLDGSDAHAITKPRLEAGNRPVWSSDGKLIYFEAPNRGFGDHLYSMTPDGGSITQLTFSPYPNGELDPSNSPRGSRLAFVSDRRYSDPTNVSDLFIMQSDGSHPHYVKTGLPLVLDPAWGTAPLQSGPSVQLPAAGWDDRSPRMAERGSMDMLRAAVPSRVLGRE
jgi:Tol biopolymer transport system component